MSTSAGTETVQCKRCDAVTPADARFCSACGAGVAEPANQVVRAPRTSQQFLLESIKVVTQGEFDVISELGRGGMATVYLAHDLTLDRKVAIKVMSPEMYGKDDMAERFKREARTAAGVSHPHIIPIYSVREIDDLVFFVMKYVEGRPLDEIIAKGGALPIPIVHAILTQVGSALEFAHRNGIVHRDVKPANILIDEDGWALVTDFGIAKVAQARALTMTGGTMGTPTYMSPEQCVGGEITGASDQYSLGIVAYQMLVGQLPYEADTVMSSMWAHVNEAPRPLEEVRPDCPAAMTSAIMRMLEKEPPKRWPAISDAIEALGPVQESQDDPTRASMVKLATSVLATNSGRISEPVRAIRSADTVAADTVNEAVAFVTISPPVGRMVAGDTLQLRAAARSGEGAELIRSVTWTSTNPAIARVSGAGLVTGLEEGVATINAACEGAVDACSVTVVPKPVKSVKVTPAHAKLRMMGTLQLQFDLADEHGNVLAPRKVNWVSSDPAVASVSADGRVFGVRPGHVLVAATIDGKRGVCVVNVTAVPVAKISVEPDEALIGIGERIQLTAEPTDDRGMPLSDRRVRWTTADRTVIALSEDGVVEGLAEGTATVRARSEEVTVPVVVTVRRVPMAALIAEPLYGALTLEQKFQFAAEPQDAGGRVLTDREATWTSSDPGIVSITPTGLATAVKNGETTIHAACEGFEAKIRVDVTRVGIAAVKVSSPLRNLEVGQEVDLRVKTYDQFKRVVEKRFIQWTSSDPTVARVSSLGRVTGVNTGPVTITATCGCHTDEVALTIKPPSFARLRIVPPSCSMPEGWQKQFSAVINNGDSASEVDCAWSVSDPSVATVTERGLVTTHRPGSVMVAAEADGKRATVRIVVTERLSDD